MTKENLVILSMLGFNLEKIKGMDAKTADLFVEEFKKLREGLTIMDAVTPTLTVGTVSNLGEDISKAKEEFDKLIADVFQFVIDFEKYNAAHKSVLWYHKHGTSIESMIWSYKTYKESGF